MLRNGRKHNITNKKWKKEKTNCIFCSKSKGKKKTIFWNRNRRRKTTLELMIENIEIEREKTKSLPAEINFTDSITGDENNDIQLYLIIKRLHIEKDFYFI